MYINKKNYQKKKKKNLMVKKYQNMSVSYILDFFFKKKIIIQKDEEIQEDVSYRIIEGLIKQRSALGILCDCTITIKLKRNFYKTAIRSATLRCLIFLTIQ